MKALLRAASATALVVLAIAAAPAFAATEISTLVPADATSVTGMGTDGAFAFAENCQVKRVTPDAGKDTGATTIVAGSPCGSGAPRTVQATAVSATSVGLDSVVPIAATADGNLLIADREKGLVYRWSSGQVQTVFGGASQCGSVQPPSSALAKDMSNCKVAAVAADPIKADRYWVLTSFAAAAGIPFDFGGPPRYLAYQVDGAARDTATATLVYGNCSSPWLSCFTVDSQAPYPDMAVLDPEPEEPPTHTLPDYLLVHNSSKIVKVNLTDHSTTEYLDSGITSVTPGFNARIASPPAEFSGDFFYSTGCLVKWVGNPGGTVAGNGNCSASGRVDGGPATASGFGPIRQIASYPGGILVVDHSDTPGAPSVIRLINRTSITTKPPAFTSLIDPASVRFDYATLDGGPGRCSVQQEIGINPPPLVPLVFDPCTGPIELLDPFFHKVWEGHYTLTVRANGEGLGLPDPTPAVWEWWVDATSPTAPDLVSPDSDTAVDSARPSLAWTGASDPGGPGFSGTTPTTPSGIDHYDLLIDGSKDSEAPCCSAALAHPLSEGSHTWRIAAVDRTGNATPSAATRTLTFTSPPKAGLTVSPNPALVGAPVTLDASSSTDREGPVASYSWDLDGDGTYESPAGASPTISTTFGQAGTHSVGVRVTDGVGNTDTATAQVKVNAQVIPAGLVGVTINNGAQYTRDPNVVLSVKYPASVTQILVSNDGGFLNPASFLTQTRINWKLDSSGPERLPKIVYLRFVTGTVVSTNYSDDIILDEIPPVVQKAALVTGPQRASSSRAARAKKYQLRVKATDSNSGVAKIQLAVNKKRPGKLVRYAAKLSYKSSARPKFIRAQDRAGNFSKWKKLR